MKESIIIIKHVRSVKIVQNCTKYDLRVIRSSEGDYAREMIKEMEKIENKEEYKKRFGTVEPIFGTLKIFYHINELPSIGKHHTEDILNLCSLSYNLNRISHEINKEFNVLDDLNIFLEKLGTQFQLDFEVEEID